MAAVAPIEDLQKVEAALVDLQEKHPEAYEIVRKIVNDNRKVGYRNICRMILGATANDLKE